MSSSSANKKLFLIGPGFIGGSLLVRLLDARPDLSLSALTRRQEQADELKSLGIEPVLGGLHDADVIKRAVLASDIVIHTATADDLPSALAVVEAIKSRPNKSKKIVYIQTSGNDELAWSSKSLAGKPVKERTLSDAEGDNVLENGRILPDALHRHVDGPLREQLFNDAAEKEHNASTTIMMPPLIYGVGAKPWQRISLQIPLLTRAMIAHKKLITLPQGFDGRWNAVNVHDLVESYLHLLKDLEAHTPGQAHPSHYMFPAEEQTVAWKDVFDAVSEQLQKHHIVEGEVTTIDDKDKFQEFVKVAVGEYAPVYAQIVFGNDNSYTRPDRLTKLGFKHTYKGPVDSVRNGGELEQVIRPHSQSK